MIYWWWIIIGEISLQPLVLRCCDTCIITTNQEVVMKLIEMYVQLTGVSSVGVPYSCK